MIAEIRPAFNADLRASMNTKMLNPTRNMPVSETAIGNVPNSSAREDAKITRPKPVTPELIEFTNKTFLNVSIDLNFS